MRKMTMTMWFMGLLLAVSLTGCGGGSDGAATPTPTPAPGVGTGRDSLGAGPAPVLLGAAGNYAILAKSGIDTVPTSAVTGDIGVSPIGAIGITGFSLTMDGTNTFSTSSQVTGKAYAPDYTSPTPSNLTTAVSNMEAAFTDAAGRPTPDFTELYSGDISGQTLVPGLYKWGTGVLISTDVTLNGGPNDVWIFQISGGITQAPAAKVILTGGALPKNIFWQTFGAVALGTTAHMEGVILSQTEITLATGATANGRLLSQTAVTLDGSTVTQPAP
ncbi:MAG: ice-binding family protein [bacterium]|nr:ice-binding family protein [bacterium]